MEAPPARLVGRYAIYGKIASGGMASVHFGRLRGAVGFSRTVAVKRLHPHLIESSEFVSTLIDEARLAARIHHPNVVPTLDVVADGDELLVVMEYVRGESLSRLLKAEGSRGHRVPLPIASAIVVGSLQGLHAAHEATSDRGTPLGIVHRDVSPQNILVGVDGVARIIDFGVAKASGRLQTTGEGVIKGKMAYMAPEQVASGEVTRRADVYAMGVVLWQTLTGQSLFKADNDAGLVAKVLAGVKEPPSRQTPNLPPGLDDLVMKALEADPADRFASAGEMAELLLRVVPPAFPTAVGRWVEELAGESLAKRGAELAEIESRSAITTVPPERGGSGVMPVPPRQGADDARVTVPELPGDLEVDAITLGSQPSSISLETPTPAVRPPSRPGRIILAGTFGAGALILAGLAAVWGARAARAPAASSSAAATTSPVMEVSAPQPQESASVLTVASSPASSPSAAALDPRPSPPPPRPMPATPAATRKTKANCNPPFVLNSVGDREYKPECF
jgi:eukaryotic-like serine/threonine-protein kinase